MRLPFVKMCGAGNDFVVLEHERVAARGEEALAQLAIDLCRRRLSVGADGLVTVEPAGEDRARMVYYNADGSRAGMCGNAGRCACRYARRKGWVGEHLILEADDGIHQAQLAGERVRLGMRDPRVLNSQVELRYGDGTFRGISIDTGVPHVVLWVDEVDQVDVGSVGRAFRFASDFQPEGANVNFVQILEPSVLRLRTYERGVEAETLACGTGAVASAVAAFLQKGARSPVELKAPGGALEVRFRADGQTVDGMSLEGDARIVFEGVVDLEH